jgi:hypothetical protein
MHYFNASRRLYIDIDAFKDYGFGVIVYHMQNDNNGPLDYTLKDNRVKIQPIIFLSKFLTGAESKYWPTKLKMAGLV